MTKLFKELFRWFVKFCFLFQVSFLYQPKSYSSDSSASDPFYNADGLPLNTVEILDKLDFNYDVFSAISPDGDFPDDYAEDFKELYIMMVSQGFLPVKTVFDLDKIVGDPFKLERKTIRKILRLPERLKFQMVRYLFTNSRNFSIEQNSNYQESYTDANLNTSITLDPERAKILPMILERSFYGILQEEEFIDLGIYLISKHEKFTPEFWEKLKKSITKHDILFAVIVSVGVLAMDFFTSRIGLGRRGWFFIEKDNKMRLGWYAKIWNLNYTMEPGAQMGLRFGVNDFESQTGIYGTVENKQLRLEQMITSSFLNKQLRPLGWMLSSSLKGKWMAMNQYDSQVNNISFDGYATARKFDLQKPGGEMIVTRLKGMTSNYGFHSAGLSLMYGNKKRMLSFSGTGFFQKENPQQSSIYTVNLNNSSSLSQLNVENKVDIWGSYTFAHTEKNIFDQKGKDLRSGLFASNLGRENYRVGSYMTLNNRIDRIEFMLKANYSNLDPISKKAKFEFGLFSGGSFDGGHSIKLDHLNSTCLSLHEKYQLVLKLDKELQELQKDINESGNTIIEKVLVSNSKDLHKVLNEIDKDDLDKIIQKSYKSEDLNKKRLWLGLARLHLKDELIDYHDTHDSYEVFSEEKVPEFFCSTDPNFFKNIEKEIDKQTFGAQNHPFYLSGK